MNDDNGATDLARSIAELIDRAKDDRDGLREVLTIKQMAKFTGGLKRSAIEALIAKGEFPAAVKLSTKRRVWLKSEILSWQLGRIAAQRKPVKRERSSK